MAAHIYDPSAKGNTLSGGWTNSHTIKGGDNMVMGVYYRVTDDGTTEYALVNKGTTPTSLSDWKNNAQQLFGSSKDMKV